jgi:hypothetical protein
MQGRFKEKELSSPGVNSGQRLQSTYRFSYAYSVTSRIKLQQRFEYTTVQYAPSKREEAGFLSYVDISVRLSALPVRYSTRFILYDTDSFDSRLYQFESDVQGNYSNPPLYGKGIRWYALVTIDFSSRFRMSAKYAETVHDGVTAFGSGDELIQGNTDSHFVLQADLEF